MISEEERKAIDFIKYYMKQYYGEEITIQDDFDFEDSIKTVLNLIEKQQREIEKNKEEYNSLINRIYNKIDKFDYEFEKAKRKNNKDRADYYWDLIVNFKKILEVQDE